MTKITAIEALHAINGFAEWLETTYKSKILEVHANAYDTDEARELPSVQILFKDIGADLYEAIMNTEQFVHGRLVFRGMVLSNDPVGPHEGVISTVSFQAGIKEQGHTE